MATTGPSESSSAIRHVLLSTSEYFQRTILDGTMPSASEVTTCSIDFTAPCVDSNDGPDEVSGPMSQGRLTSAVGRRGNAPCRWISSAPLYNMMSQQESSLSAHNNNANVGELPPQDCRRSSSSPLMEGVSGTARAGRLLVVLGQRSDHFVSVLVNTLERDSLATCCQVNTGACYVPNHRNVANGIRSLAGETVDGLHASATLAPRLYRPSYASFGSEEAEEMAPPRSPSRHTPSSKSEVALSFILPRNRADDEELLSRVPSYATVSEILMLAVRLRFPCPAPCFQHLMDSPLIVPSSHKSVLEKILHNTGLRRCRNAVLPLPGSSSRPFFIDDRSGTLTPPPEPFLSTDDQRLVALAMELADPEPKVLIVGSRVFEQFDDFAAAAAISGLAKQAAEFGHTVIAALGNNTASGSLASAALLSSADLLLLDVNGRATYHGPGESLRQGLEGNGLPFPWPDPGCSCCRGMNDIAVALRVTSQSSSSSSSAAQRGPEAATAEVVETAAGQQPGLYLNVAGGLRPLRCTTAPANYRDHLPPAAGSAAPAAASRDTEAIPRAGKASCSYRVTIACSPGSEERDHHREGKGHVANGGDDEGRDAGSCSRDHESPDDDVGSRQEALWALLDDDDDEDGASTPASAMKELPGFPRSSAPSMHQARNPSFGSLRRPSGGSSAPMMRPCMTPPLEGGLCSSPAEFPPDNNITDNGNCGPYGDAIEVESNLSCDGSRRSSGRLVLEEEVDGALQDLGDNQDENEARQGSNKSLTGAATAAVLSWIPCPTCPTASPSSGGPSSAQRIITCRSSPLSPSPSLRRSQSWGSSLMRASDSHHHCRHLESFTPTTTPLFSSDVVTAKSSPAVPPPTASSPPMSFRVKTSGLRTVSCAASAPEVAALLEKSYRLLNQAEEDDEEEIGSNGEDNDRDPHGEEEEEEMRGGGHGSSSREDPCRGLLESAAGRLRDILAAAAATDDTNSDDGDGADVNLYDRKVHRSLTDQASYSPSAAVICLSQGQRGREGSSSKASFLRRPGDLLRRGITGYAAPWKKPSQKQTASIVSVSSSSTAATSSIGGGTGGSAAPLVRQGSTQTLPGNSVHVADMARHFEDLMAATAANFDSPPTPVFTRNGQGRGKGTASRLSTVTSAMRQVVDRSHTEGPLSPQSGEDSAGASSTDDSFDQAAFYHDLGTIPSTGGRAFKQSSSNGTGSGVSSAGPPIAHQAGMMDARSTFAMDTTNAAGSISEGPLRSPPSAAPSDAPAHPVPAQGTNGASRESPNASCGGNNDPPATSSGSGSKSSGSSRSSPRPPSTGSRRIHVLCCTRPPGLRLSHEENLVDDDDSKSAGVEHEANGADCEAPEEPLRDQGSPEQTESAASATGAATTKHRRSLIPTPSRIPRAPAGMVLPKDKKALWQQLQHKTTKGQPYSPMPAPAETQAAFFGPARQLPRRQVIRGMGHVHPLAARPRDHRAVAAAAAAAGELLERSRPGGWLRFQNLQQPSKFRGAKQGVAAAVNKARGAAAVAAVGVKPLGRAHLESHPLTFTLPRVSSVLPFSPAVKVGPKAAGVEAVKPAAAQGPPQSSGMGTKDDEKPAAASSIQFSLCSPLFPSSSAAAEPKAATSAASTVHDRNGASESSPPPTSSMAEDPSSSALRPPTSGPDRPPAPFSTIRFSLRDGSSRGSSRAPEKIPEGGHQQGLRALAPLASLWPQPAPPQQPLHDAVVGSSLEAWLPSLLEAEAALASPKQEDEHREPNVDDAAPADDDSGPPPLGSTISSMAAEEDRDASRDSDLPLRERWALVVAELKGRFRRRDQKRPMEPPNVESPGPLGLRSFQHCQPDPWGASSSNASSLASARAAAHSVLFDEAESSAEAPMPGDYDSDNDTAFDPEEASAGKSSGAYTAWLASAVNWKDLQQQAQEEGHTDEEKARKELSLYLSPPSGSLKSQHGPQSSSSTSQQFSATPEAPGHSNNSPSAVMTIHSNPLVSSSGPREEDNEDPLRRRRSFGLPPGTNRSDLRWGCASPFSPGPFMRLAATYRSSSSGGKDKERGRRTSSAVTGTASGSPSASPSSPWTGRNIGAALRCAAEDRHPAAAPGEETAAAEAEADEAAAGDINGSSQASGGMQREDVGCLENGDDVREAPEALLAEEASRGSSGPSSPANDRSLQDDSGKRCPSSHSHHATFQSSDITWPAHTAALWLRAARTSFRDPERAQKLVLSSLAVATAAAGCFTSGVSSSAPGEGGNAALFALAAAGVAAACDGLAAWKGSGGRVSRDLAMRVSYGAPAWLCAEFLAALPFLLTASMPLALLLQRLLRVTPLPPGSAPWPLTIILIPAAALHMALSWCAGLLCGLVADAIRRHRCSPPGWLFVAAWAALSVMAAASSGDSLPSPSPLPQMQQQQPLGSAEAASQAGSCQSPPSAAMCLGAVGGAAASATSASLRWLCALAAPGLRLSHRTVMVGLSSGGGWYWAFGGLWMLLVVTLTFLAVIALSMMAAHRPRRSSSASGLHQRFQQSGLRTIYVALRPAPLQEHSNSSLRSSNARPLD